MIIVLVKPICRMPYRLPAVPCNGPEAVRIGFHVILSQNHFTGEVTSHSKFDQIFSKLISTASVACYYEKITRVHVNFGSGSITYFDSKSYI